MKTVKNISAKASADVVMDLLPVRTRPAKEIVSLMIEYAFPSLKTMNGGQDTLLLRAVQYERMDYCFW